MKNSFDKKAAGKSRKGVSAYDEALCFLTPKTRTVRETEDHLDECDYAEMEIFDAIERLKENGLLNDEKYAADFIESRLNTKPVSRQKLREQLEGHLIGRETVDAALEAVTAETELNNCRSIAEKFFRQFSALDLTERLRRVGLRLVSRGYSYDDIKQCLGELTEGIDDEE